MVVKFNVSGELFGHNVTDFRLMMMIMLLLLLLPPPSLAPSATSVNLRAAFAAAANRAIAEQQMIMNI